MKKLMMALMGLLVVVPVGFVKAEESANYYSYTKGEVINFYSTNDEYANKTKNTGLVSIALEDKEAASGYVKIFGLGFNYGAKEDYCDNYGVDKTATSYKYTIYYKEFVGALTNDKASTYVESTFLKDTDSVELMSLADIIDIFGATDAGNGTYTIDVAKTLTTAQGNQVKIGDLFTQEFVGTVSGNGFYTATMYDATQVYAVVFTHATPGDNSTDITGITVKPVAIQDSATDYAMVGTMYFDMTKDCYPTTVKKNCYVCNNTYSWLTTGTQDSSCTLVTGVTDQDTCVAPKACYNCDGTYKWYNEGSQDSTCTKVDNVTSESSCVVSPKTGVSTHILEFAIMASVCAIILVVVRRKELFKSI